MNNQGNKMMKLKFISMLLIMIFLISAVGLIAQEKDENGFYIYKQLTENDMKRIFGEEWPPKVMKVNGESRYIKESIINGNKITTILYNYGSICKPNTLGNIADLVWQGLGYGFEFGPLAAAEIAQGTDTLEIVSDSFVLTGQGDYSPDGTVKWGWLPKAGFVDTTEGQTEIARLNIGDKDGDGKPDSWPERWYNAESGQYLWPAFLGDAATAPDEEVYFVVDDFTNAEFDYYPFGKDGLDSLKRGLGLDMDVRVLQFNNPLAEDIMFLVYQVTNASEKSLDRVYFGMHGDPHVGGPANWNDDKAGFIDPFGNSNDVSNVSQRARNMVYSWDQDMTGDGGRPAGYFGWKFLESPTNSNDFIDNDDDGINDESPNNSAGVFLDGITLSLITPNISDLDIYTTVYGEPRPRWTGDEDGDWTKEFDDIGIDGIGPESVNYPGPDFGEGDGKPSQGWFVDANGNAKLDPEEVGSLSEERFQGSFWGGSEPNFGFRDISESDQLGLTSFHAAGYTNSDPNVPRNDPLMWEWLSSDSLAIDDEFLETGGDNIFNFGTGPLVLAPGESQRFSMSILFGNDLSQLILNAESSTRILESDYRFAKPPEKPNMRAVPGDGRVTLYWDRASEESFDPFLRLFDFQGYKIYRSLDPNFSDVKTITDGFGNPFIGEGIAQFDLDDSLSGFHPIEFLGRGIKYNMGTNTGLVHEFVDSTVQNGITYYYAVAAFDGGSIEFGLPPSETQTVISRDPITDELTFDVNTAVATPMASTPGVVQAAAGIDGIPNQILGNSTGDIVIKVLEGMEVDDKLYSIEFEEPELYSVLDSTGVQEEFRSKGTIFVDLQNQNIIESSIQVTDAAGSVVDPSRYELKANLGKIKGIDENSLPAGELFNISYRYYPIFQSDIVDGSDANVAFDGLRVYVQADPLDLDEDESGWKEDNTEFVEVLLGGPNNQPVDMIGDPRVQYRADWEFRWNSLDTLSDGTWANVGDTTLAVPSFVESVAPFSVYNTSEFDEEGNPIKGNFLVAETVPTSPNYGNGQWDWGEPILLRATEPGGAAEVSYYVKFH
jgi:hypothetical protein